MGRTQRKAQMQIEYIKWKLEDPAERAKHICQFKQMYRMLEIDMNAYGFVSNTNRAVSSREDIDAELDRLAKESGYVVLARVLACPLEEELAGYAMIRPSVYYPTLLNVSGIFVRAPYRRRGVGTGLLSFIESQGKDAGFSVIGLHVHLGNPALNLYTAQGFSPCSQYMEKGIV